MEKISKWLYVEAAFNKGGSGIGTQDPILAKLLDNSSEVSWKLTPINLDCVQEVLPASSSSKHSIIEYKNGSYTTINMSVSEVYEKLLKREEYVEKSASTLVAEILSRNAS